MKRDPLDVELHPDRMKKVKQFPVKLQGSFYCLPTDVYTALLGKADRAEELEAELVRVRAQLDLATTHNESVSVCKDHTSEVTTFDGCLVCEFRSAEATLDELYDRADSLVKDPLTDAEVVRIIEASRV